MRISDWSSDVCSSDLLGKLLSPTAPADIITYVVDVDFYRGDDCFETEVFTIVASTHNGAQHRALDLSLDSRSEDRRVGKECVSPRLSRGFQVYENKKRRKIVRFIV